MATEEITIDLSTWDGGATKAQDDLIRCIVQDNASLQLWEEFKLADAEISIDDFYMILGRCVLNDFIIKAVVSACEDIVPDSTD